MTSSRPLRRLTAIGLAVALTLSCAACAVYPEAPGPAYYGYGPDYPWAASSVNIDIGHGGYWHGGYGGRGYEGRGGGGYGGWGGGRR